MSDSVTHDSLADEHCRKLQLWHLDRVDPLRVGGVATITVNAGHASVEPDEDDADDVDTILYDPESPQ